MSTTPDQPIRCCQCGHLESRHAEDGGCNVTVGFGRRRLIIVTTCACPRFEPGEEEATL